jgi:hypothetical protein
MGDKGHKTSVVKIGGSGKWKSEIEYLDDLSAQARKAEQTAIANRKKRKKRK